jgi:glycosyltransferase involved in cell wall biosynthesis
LGNRFLHESNELKIAHVSFSKTGGAGEVASELANSQRLLGFSSRAIFLVEGGIAKEVFRHPLIFMAAILDFRIQANSMGQLFTLFRNRLSNSRIESTMKQFDIINLHWTPGMLSNKSIQSISNVANKKIVWTLHDMRPFTGGCHHSGECQNFISNCRKCPQVHPFLRKTVAKNFSRDTEALLQIENLLVVSPSKWISDLARISRPMRHLNHLVIHNPVDCKVFHPSNSHLGLKQIDANEITIGLCATNLSDSKKNVHGAVEIVRQFRDLQQRKDVKLLLIGGNPPKDLPSFVKLAGVINDKERLAGLYQEMDLYLTLSLEENFPNTLLESQACGVPAVCLNRGGMPEIVLDGLSGFVVNDQVEALDALVKILTGNERESFAEMSRSHAIENFNSKKIAMQYLVEAYQII